MMGRLLIAAILALLVTLASNHSSEKGSNAAEPIEQSNEIQASSMKTSVFRGTRDAEGKSHRGRKGNNLNKNNPDKGRKKSKGNKNTGKNKNNIGRKRKNGPKLKKKGKKLRKKKTQLTKNKKNGQKNDKKASKRKKKKSRQKKKSKKNKNELRKNRKKLGQETIKKSNLPKQACDEAVLCQKIKDYIKISNQLRKVRRIVKSCETMDKKAKKSTAEFEATVTALETAIGSSSGRRVYRSRWRRATESKDDITNIKDKLKNCSISAKAKCQKSSVAPCQEEANLTKCETELQGWLTKFGPANGSCLQASSDCCTCISALPDVSKDCLEFDKKSTIAVASKKKCTSGDEQGSFGFCKKLQLDAAEKGPKHAKDNCKSMDKMTTKGPSVTGVLECLNPPPAINYPCKIKDGQTVLGSCCLTGGIAICYTDGKSPCAQVTSPPGYKCGTEISNDCQQEYDNAKNNGKLDEFYKRCKEEGGANPLRDRCSLCCP